MVSKEEILANLSKYTIEGNEEECRKWAEIALKNNIDAYDAIMKGCAEGMRTVSELYDKGEYYVPDILIAADAMTAAVEILKPHIKIDRLDVPIVVVLGVVEGDVHDIGKNLVKILLSASGFEVTDLGRDVPIADFINTIKEKKPNILGMSALMTTTMPKMKDIVENLEKEGLKSELPVIIGGAPTSLEFAKKIGADSWAKDASSAVTAIRQLIGK